MKITLLPVVCPKSVFFKPTAWRRLALLALALAALASPAAAQINVTANTSTTVDADPDNPGGASGTVIHIDPGVELTGSPGILRDTGAQPLTVNFGAGAQIITSATASAGIKVGLPIDSLTVNGGTISAPGNGSDGIGTDDLTGSFNNSAAIEAAGDFGIAIEGTVGNGFTNSGQIGTGTGVGQYVGQLGIAVSGQITGDFLNSGAIFSNNASIVLVDSVTSVTGNFTNTGELYSVDTDPVIEIEGDIGGAFDNSGAITSVTATNRGIDIGGTVGNGFTNTGVINTTGAGIRVSGQITGDFLNDTAGTIITQNSEAILLEATGTSLTGNFTNHADLEGGNAGIRINGAVGGSFTNTGAVRVDGSGNGINLSGAVGTGFTNSGSIGTSVDRIGGKGIQATGAITGNVLIDTGGNVYSTSDGVFMPIGGITGNFTNNATIDSLNETGVEIFAFGGTLDGNFINNGTITGGALGVEIGSLEAGHTFENTGTITGNTDDGVQITLSGTGTHTLTNSGTVTGNTRAVEIIGGGITLNNTGTVNGDVVLGAASSGDVAGNHQNTVTLGATGVINGVLDVGTSTATTVTLNGTGTRALSAAVTGGINSGASTNQIDGSLEKDGTGTWTIDQNLTVGQGNTISDGTLLIASGSTLGGDVTVNTGIFGGDGTAGGNVNVNSGGTLAPGNSPGTFTIGGDLTLAGLTVIEIASAVSFDQIEVGGMLTYGGDILFNFSYLPSIGQNFSIFDFDPGEDSGSFANVNFSDPGITGTFDNSTGFLSVTAVPEPATYAAILGCLGLGLALTRRKARA